MRPNPLPRPAAKAAAAEPEEAPQEKVRPTAPLLRRCWHRDPDSQRGRSDHAPSLVRFHFNLLQIAKRADGPGWAGQVRVTLESEETIAEMDDAAVRRLYHAFGLIGTALSKKISVFQSSSPKVVPISPNASYHPFMRIP